MLLQVLLELAFQEPAEIHKKHHLGERLQEPQVESELQNLDRAAWGCRSLRLLLVEVVGRVQEVVVAWTYWPYLDSSAAYRRVEVERSHRHQGAEGQIRRLAEEAEGQIRRRVEAERSCHLQEEVGGNHYQVEEVEEQTHRRVEAERSHHRQEEVGQIRRQVVEEQIRLLVEEGEE